MGYQIKTVDAGKVRCKKYYHSWRYKPKGSTRQKREKPTPEAMKKVNEAHAVEKLYFKMCANFTSDDFYLTLKYDGVVNKSISSQQLKKDKEKFLRLLRAKYRKDGKELKFIICYGISANRVRHLHAVVSGGDIGEIRDCWHRTSNHAGRVTAEPLWKNYEYKGLAEYFIKNGKEAAEFDSEQFTQLYSCSRNLNKPVENVKTVLRSGTFRKNEPKVDEGYYLVKDSVEKGVDCFGFVFFKYTMIKRE